MSFVRDALTWVDTGAVAYPALHQHIIELTMPALIVKRLLPEFPLVAGRTATFTKEKGSRSIGISAISEASESVIPLVLVNNTLTKMPLPKGFRHSGEAKRKISKASKEEWANPQFREARKANVSGAKNPFYGKHLSEEAKRAHGEVMKQKWADPTWRAKAGSKIPLFKKGQVPWNKGKPCPPEIRVKMSRIAKERMKGFTKEGHTAKALETVEELESQGFKIVFVDDNGVRPDIICLKDGAVYQIEIEKKGKRGREKRKSPYCDEMKIVYY